MKTLVKVVNDYKIYSVVEGRSKFHYVAKDDVTKNGFEYEMVHHTSKTLKACVEYAKAN